MSNPIMKARYDAKIDTPIKNVDGAVTSHKIHHHFIFGKVGSPISGGIYFREGVEIPESITLELGKMREADNG